MVRMGTLLIRRLAPAVVCALAIAACGSTQKPATSTSTTPAAPGKGSSTVAIYSSLPDSGAEAAQSHQIETGIQLALKVADHKARSFTVTYHQLCDSAVPRKRSHTPTSRSKISTGARTDTSKCIGNWSQTRVVHNAEEAARNPQTIAYIGDLNSGATALSLPILNQAGIVQVTPGSGYPGLTNSVTVKTSKGTTNITAQGEPDKYYPQGSGNRTLLRMIPNDLVQASAALKVLRKTGCQKFAAWNFGTDPESKALFEAVIATAPEYKMDYAATPPLTPKTNPYAYAHALAPTGIHCAVMVGHVTHSAVALTTYLRTQFQPTIVGTNGFCNANWVRGISKSVAKSVVPGLLCMTAALPVKAYDGYTVFAKLFRSRYDREPTAYNLYGYAASEMLLRALHDIDSGDDDDARQQVLTIMAYNEIDDTPGQTSAFSFDSDGNFETNNDYGVDAFKRGTPQHYETVSVDVAHLLSSAG